MKKLWLLGGLMLLTLNVCRVGAAPPVPDNPPDPALFARAVNYYVALGEKKAFRKLYFHAKYPLTRADFHTEWLCRALYAPKPGQALRAAAVGRGGFYSHWPDTYVDWPLLPLARAGKSYFVLIPGSGGVTVGGPPERSWDYLKFCRENGVFRTQPVPVPTRAEALHDAKALRRSTLWKAVQWRVKQPDGSYRGSDESTWQEILAQANAVQEP